MNIVISKASEIIVNEKIYNELVENGENLNNDYEELEQLKDSLSLNIKVSLTYIRSKEEKSREGYFLLENGKEVGYVILIEKEDFLEIDINIYKEHRGKGVFKDSLPKILALYPDRNWIIHVYKLNSSWQAIKRVAELNGFTYQDDPMSLDHKMIKKAHY